jgi:hypothetical protein
MTSLLGRWRLLRADRSLDFAPGVRMAFVDAATMLYSFEVGDVRQQVELRYRVDGDLLRTEVPGTTHEATARFEFGPGDALVLDFAGARAWFVREVDSSPPPHGSG